MAYDNQTAPTGVLYTPSASDWTTDAATGLLSASYSTLTLDPKVSDADQIVVIRQFDFSTIASTPSPLLTGAETWDVWTLPNTSNSGSSMYTVDTDNKKILMSSTATDYVFSRSSGDVTLPVFTTSHQVYIMRKTQDLTNYINWAAGSRITSDQLNHAFKQMLNVSQEITVLNDNYSTLSPFTGKPDGVCPLDATGKIASTYIGSATLNNTTGAGISGTGASDAPLAIDRLGDGVDDSLTSGLSVTDNQISVASVDGLDSTNEIRPLSSNQGRILKDLIDGIGTAIVYKGGFDLVTKDATDLGTPAAGWTVGHTGTGTTSHSSWGGITIANGNLVRYNGTAWQVVQSAENVRVDGNTELTGSWDTGEDFGISTKTQSLNQDTRAVATTAWVRRHTGMDGTAGNMILANLPDVGDAPSDGDVLKYDSTSSTWLTVQTDDDTSGVGFSDLNDVDLSSPSNGQILKHDGTNWANVADPDLTTVIALVDSAADHTGATDSASYVATAMNASTLGHTGIPAQTTIGVMDFHNGHHLIGTDTDDPSSSNTSKLRRQGVTYRNGTLEANWITASNTNFLIDQQSNTEYSTNLSSAAYYKQNYILVDSVQYLSPGTLVYIGSDTALQTDLEYIWQRGNANNLGKVINAGEMNVVTSVERPNTTGTGRKVTLKYPLASNYQDNEKISMAFVDVAAASSTITVPADTSPTDFDTGTVILEAADGEKVTFTAGTSWTISDTGTTYATNMSAAINAHAKFTAASSGTLVTTITQAINGSNGNTTLEGTLLASTTETNFTGGVSSQVKNIVFENMKFKSKKSGEMYCDANPISTHDDDNTKVTLTLPDDHNWANGTTGITLDIQNLDATSNVFGTDQDSGAGVGKVAYTALNGNTDAEYNTSHESNSTPVTANQLTLTIGNSENTATLLTGSDQRGGETAFVMFGSASGVELDWAENVTFKNCEFEGLYYGIRMNRSANIVIDNCTFNRSRSTNVLFKGLCRDVTIKDCTFNQGYAYNIRVGEGSSGDSTLYRMCSDIKIKDNIMNAWRPIFMDERAGLFNSEITGNSITALPRNDKIHPQGRTAHHNSSYAIFSRGWKVRISDNTIGGRFYGGSLTTDQKTPNSVGYGYSSNGDKDYAYGLEFDSNRTNANHLTCRYGIVAHVKGSGRKDTDGHKVTGVLDNPDNWQKNRGTQSPGAQDLAPIIIENNTIEAWDYGVSVSYKAGTAANPGVVNQGKICDNSILSHRYGIWVNQGFNEQLAAVSTRICDNNVSVMPGPVSLMPRNESSGATHDDAVTVHYGITITGAKDGEDIGRQRWYSTVIDNNSIELPFNANNEASTHGGIRFGNDVADDSKAFVMTAVRNNNIYGGVYGISTNTALGNDDVVSNYVTNTAGNTMFWTQGRWIANASEFAAASNYNQLMDTDTTGIAGYNFTRASGMAVRD